MIAYAGLRVARSAPRAPTPSCSPAGITSLILCQALLNVFAVLGLAPLTGVPLPFISYGSTTLIVLLAGDGPAAQRRRRRHRAPARGRRLRRRGRIARDGEIVIAAGGTAGHVVPALAVADALRADGAEVVFVGGERAEARARARRRLRAATARASRASAARNPLKAARAVAARRPARSARRARILRAPRAGRGARRRRLRRRPGRRWPPCCRAHPARAHRGRLPPRPDQPPARAVARARLPGVPARGPRRRRATASPGAPCRRRTPTAPAPARGFGIGRGRDLRARLRRLARRPLDQPGRRRRRSRDAPFRVLHVAGRARLRRAAARGRPARRTTTCATTSRPFGAALAAADLAVARAGGSVFELAAARPARRSCPYPHAAADHQTANARWMADAGAAVVLPDAELTAERLRARGRRAAGRPGRARGDGRGRRAALARPDAARDARGVRRQPAAAGVGGREGCRRHERRPWAGRRLHFVGVGGAGMSAYALAAARARRPGQRAPTAAGRAPRSTASAPRA